MTRTLVETSLWMALAVATEVAFRSLWSPLVVDVPFLLLAWATSRPQRPNYRAVVCGVLVLILVRTQIGSGTIVDCGLPILLGVAAVVGVRRLFDRRQLMVRAGCTVFGAWIVDVSARALAGTLFPSPIDSFLFIAFTAAVTVAFFTLWDEVAPRVFRDARRGL